MKKLEDLKREILNNNIGKFYVFYGEDFGLRKHYIDRISKSFTKKSLVDSCNDVSSRTITKSLFKITTLYIVHGDVQFPRQNKNQIQTFINRLNDCAVILEYEEPLLNTTLFKEFSEYITYFPTVQKNIALEFIDSELKLSQECKEDMAYNCNNNYNNILLESDKIRNYASIRNLSEQNSYDALNSMGQLLYEYPEFECNIFMNYILSNNYTNIDLWIKLIKNKYIDKFYMSLTSMFYDFLIAYLVRKYGRWDGSSRAYKYGLSWGRAKVIRDINLVQDADYYLDCAYRISGIDVKIKSGKLLREDVIDEFLSQVV